MSVLVATLGLPGSGKSSWAREQAGFARVNRDDLRSMLWVEAWSGDQERATRAVRDGAIRALLARGLSVIVDDTGFESLPEMEALAAVAGAEFRVQDFTGVPIEECIRRDGLRERPVGERVIREMAVRNGLLESGR